MKIIKLDAIDSTNTFLKELAHNTRLENFTVVTAKSQKKGRGQMGATWVSKPGKNLICSVYVAFDAFLVKDKVLINYAVSLAIIDVLDSLKIPRLAIKWPNDILSSGAKICGILIENVMRGKEIESAIIGIGLNVNQIAFPEHLSKVTSIRKEMASTFDLDAVLVKLVTALKSRMLLTSSKDAPSLKVLYLNWLYKKNTPSMFKDSSGVLFMGKIINVTSQGKLQIELEDASIQEFGIKEVSFA